VALEKGSLRKRPSSLENINQSPQASVYPVEPGKWNGSLPGRLYTLLSESRSRGSGGGRGPCRVAARHWGHTAANRTRSTWAGRRRRIRPARSSGMSDHDVPVVSAIGRSDPANTIGKKQQPSAWTHIAFINRQRNTSSVGGARLHRRQTGNASNTLRARPAARPRGAEGVGTEERRVRGKECWRLTGNRRLRQGESCSSSCCSGGGGGGGPAGRVARWRSKW